MSSGVSQFELPLSLVRREQPVRTRAGRLAVVYNFVGPGV